MKKNYLIARADPGDMPEIISLLLLCSLMTEDIHENRQTFWTAKSENLIVGTVAVENFDTIGLLRSFAVHPSFRKQGIGSALLGHAIEQSGKMGIGSLYLCTDTADLYFEKHNWLYVNRETADKRVQQSEEFRSPWSGSTVCMFFPVKPGRVKTAVELYQSGFNCAQAVFSSFAPVLGMEAKEALKIASGFGAGICYKGEICGAVSGAYMAIGLKCGRWKAEDSAAKENTYALMREFDQLFMAMNGSLHCGKLLGGDMSTPEGRKKINDERKFKTHCPRFVRDAAEITEKLLQL